MREYGRSIYRSTSIIVIFLLFLRLYTDRHESLIVLSHNHTFQVIIMKTILFPTDLSDAANKAYVYALHLADRLHARVVTLHAFQKPEIRGATHIPRMLEEFYKEFDILEFGEYKGNIPQLMKIADDSNMSHVEVSHRMEEGETIPTILRIAQEEQADLIVMGTTGARGLKEIFLGSVAGEVLENAACPVLAVPEDASFDGKVDRIALSTALNSEDERALDKLLEIGAIFHAEIHCLHVDLGHTESVAHRMQQLRDKYASQPGIFFHVLEGLDYLPTMTAFLQNNQIDWIAMVAHKRNFWQELLHYSKTKAMSYHADTPILSFPEGMLK